MNDDETVPSASRRRRNVEKFYRQIKTNSLAGFTQRLSRARREYEDNLEGEFGERILKAWEGEAGAKSTYDQNQQTEFDKLKQEVKTLIKTLANFNKTQFDLKNLLVVKFLL